MTSGEKREVEASSVALTVGRWLPVATLLPRLAFGAAVLLMNVGDIVTTNALIRRGGRELNPLAGWLLQTGQLAPVKLVLSALVGVLILVAPLQAPARWVCRLVVAFYALVLTVHLLELVAAA